MKNIIHISQNNFRQTGVAFALFLSVFLLAISGGLFPAASQTIPIDDIKEEQLRIQQLIHGSEYSSFTNRPTWNHIYQQYMDLGSDDYGIWSRVFQSPEYEYKSYFKVGLYSPNVEFTANSSVPYGENNEAAWYGKGFNTELQGGFWFTSDFLTITFRPHLVSQQNLEFDIPRFIPNDESGNIRYIAEGIGNQIDKPFRFGPDTFQTFSLGYSSVRVHYKSIEAGVSTEPMWWGANVKYPLIMSNNAPGMPHFFIGTRGPLKIPYVGNFEFKWLGGFPEDSDYFDQEFQYQKDRFMNAINLSYSPFFAPNVHVGLTRAVHTYLEAGNLTSEELGYIFDPFFYKNFEKTRGPVGIIKPRNHLNSLYARWVWPQSRMEIYGEYFRDDFAWDARDLLMEPRHNSGYAFGFQKLIFAPLVHFYKLNVEFTNMTPGYLEEVRPQNYFYTDEAIRQGHTNRGQLIGAAIGPGSNSQFLGLDAYFDTGRIGIFARRLADNNHFHYEYDRFLNRPPEFRQGFGDYWRNRTDLTLGTRGLFYFENFLISANISWTKLLNYGRYNYGEFGGLNISNFEPNDKTNIQFHVGVTYQF